MGYDVVGEIDQVGDDVHGFKVGDRVAGMTVIGSNATYRTLRADDLTGVPPDVDAGEAATLILSWMTAYQLLHRAARVQRGQRALVHGAAGAVGQALLVLGKLAGLEFWAPRAVSMPRWSANSAAHRSTTSKKTLRASWRAGSTSSSTGSARTAIDARSKRSSRAACSSRLATRLV
jgi:Zn-dependent alcohol dehydrogenase